MLRSNSDTTTSASSPTAASPFSSNYSVPSEPTSDEAPDLGQFNAVLRAWTYLQPPFPRLLHPSLGRQHEHTSSSSRHADSFPTLTSEIESDGQGQPRSTVWAHGPIASYLASGDFTTDTETDRERDNNPTSLTTSSISTRAFLPIPQRTRRSDDERDADVEDEDYSHSDSRGDHPRSVQIEDLDELDSSFGHDIYDDDESNDIQPVEPGSLDLSQLHLNEGDHPNGLGDITLQDFEEQPSLGYLDEALRFIAAERLRWNAQREVGLNATSPSASESRRKRRRKRKTPRAQSVTRTSTTSTTHGLVVPSAAASASTPSLLTTYSANPGDDGEDADADNSSSSYDQHYSSSSHHQIRQPLFKSTPGTPGSRRRGAQLKKQTPQRKLKHASSTPMLWPPSRPIDVDEPANPRLGLLRSLGKKLETIFPEDKSFLATVTYGTLPLLLVPNNSYFDTTAAGDPANTGVLGNFVDTRGASTQAVKSSGEAARIIHVFVDHSNILIGLLNYLKRHPRQHPQYSQQSSGGDNGQGSLSSPVNIHPKPPKHLSHSALALILERGRPVMRRVLVTSSPLYQPMNSAELLGYEVKVFARVPDLGDGLDKERQRPGVGHSRSNSYGSFNGNGNIHSNSGSGSGGGGAEVSASPKKGRRRAGSVNAGTSGPAGPPATSNNRNRGHRRGFSHGGTSTESEQGVSSASGIQHSPFARGNPASGGIPFGSPALASLLSSTPPTTTPGGTVRVRYREQGVDELLQLKLHQAIASIDGPPPKGSTIVLATGDGNAGQFNEDGFLGSVRTALKRGWKVELYAWEGGLSKSWKREFGEASEWGARANGNDGAKFKIIGMEQFGSELVEIYF